MYLKRFSVTTLVNIRVADVLGEVDVEDATKVAAVIRSESADVASVRPHLPQLYSRKGNTWTLYKRTRSIFGSK